MQPGPGTLILPLSTSCGNFEFLNLPPWWQSLTINATPDKSTKGSTQKVIAHAGQVQRTFCRKTSLTLKSNTVEQALIMV
jgi:hypothetical protein